ncbi:MAG: LLM class flavin-dependent oxidoreductase [Actinomycetota bacterium]
MVEIHMVSFRGLGLSLSNEESASATLAMAQKADRLGFDEISIPESRLHRSLFAMAGAILATTRETTVRVGIANPVTRHPAVLAMEAATLAEIGPGRLRFGIGAAEWTMRQLGYAPPSWRPYTNTVEAVRAIRRLLDGEAIGFDPTTFAASATTRLDFVASKVIPIDMGAVNGRMMEAAGELANGVQLGALTSPGYVRWAREKIAAGARRVGRKPEELLLAANILTSVSPDRAAARAAVREVLAYYLYRVEGVVVETSGVDPEQRASIRREVASKGVVAGARLVNDQLIDIFAVAGTVDDVIERLMPFARAGLQVPLAWHVFGPDRDWALAALAEQVRPALLS